MNASIGDRLLMQHCNRNGFYYIKSDIDSRYTPAIVEVPFNGGINLCNTSNGNVYQQMDWTPTVMNNGASTCIAAPNNSLQMRNTAANNPTWVGAYAAENLPTFPASTLATRPGWSNRSGINLDQADPSRKVSWSRTADTPYNQSCNQPSTRTGPYQTTISSWTISNLRQGVRVLTVPELRRIEMPETPTKFHADSLFNDELYVSLQGDILPCGANPLDDYMHVHRDSRSRIYFEAAIGNQGCSCEHDKTNLDKYLTRNKDVTSAIALRATLSDELRRQVQEPTDSKILKDYAQAFKGQAERLLKAAQNLFNQPDNTRATPWDAYDEDENMLIE